VPIETITGPVEPGELGATLMHEHVGFLEPSGLYACGEETPDLSERALSCLPGHGIRTVVDLTGRARATTGVEFDRLRALSKSLSLHIVAGFSFYKEPWLGAAGTEDLDELTAIYVGAAEAGGIGIYGEVGTSLDEITPLEDLHLRAAARGHVRTGLAISTHCTLGTMALEQVAVLVEEGVDVSRIVIGHLDLRPDVAYLEQVLETGVNIAFDTFGKEWFDYRVPGSEGEQGAAFVKHAYHRPDDARVEALVTLCADGYASQIVMSTDLSGLEAHVNPATHGRHGYGFLPAVILPRLRQAGIDESSLTDMMATNPVRILTIP